MLLLMVMVVTEEGWYEVLVGETEGCHDGRRDPK
jgi:hypothetical protein